VSGAFDDLDAVRGRPPLHDEHGGGVVEMVMTTR
jgi:hypothetical protein